MDLSPFEQGDEEQDDKIRIIKSSNKDQVRRRTLALAQGGSMQ